MGKVVRCPECAKVYRGPDELEVLRDNDSICLVCNAPIEVSDWDRILGSWEDQEDLDDIDDDIDNDWSQDDVNDLFEDVDDEDDGDGGDDGDGDDEAGLRPELVGDIDDDIEDEDEERA